MKMLNTFGSVDIYADPSNNLIIISTGENKNGDTVLIDVVSRVKYPYEEIDLEETLFKHLELCHSKIPEGDNETVLEKVTRKKGYGKATKNLRLTSVFWNIDIGFLVEPFQRVPRKGYRVLDEHKILLGKKPEPGRLATAVKKSIELSRI
jgi:hypothetical protein